MKRILLLFVVLFGIKGQSQTTVFSENFGIGSQISAIAQISSNTSDWMLNNGQSSSPPAGPGSAASMLFGPDATIGSTQSVVTTAINTSSFTSLSITWNNLYFSTSSPLVSFSISTTGAAGSWTNIPYISNSNFDDTWAAVSTLTLPSNAISTTLFLCWSYTSTGTASEYVAIDDILLTGIGTPVFYYDGTAGLTNTVAWWSNPNFTGSNPNNFTNPGQTFNILQPIATLTTNWVVSGSNTAVYVGDGTVPNKCHLTFTLGGILSLSSSSLYITDNSSLTLQDATFPAETAVSVSTLSTIHFSQTAASVTIWDPLNGYGNLFLSGGGTKAQPAINDIIVNGVFNIASGTTYLMVNSSTKSTRLRGQVTCAGNISTNFSNLIFEGLGTVGTVNFSGTNAINGLTMNRSGQNLTLAGSDLNIGGVVTASVGTIASGAAPGKLKLKANTLASRNGRIGPITGNITGNIQVETRAPGPTTDWAVLGPSGVSGLQVSDWEGQIPMSCYNCPNDENSASGHFVSIQGWDETAPASSTVAYIEMSYTDPLNFGTGYWVYLGNGQYTTTAITWTVAGPIVKGPQSINLTNSTASNGDGYNLISNPFACPISWSALRNLNTNVDNAYYVYSADFGNTMSFINGNSVPSGSLSNTIPMGQGFYVRATNNTNLTAQESNKVTGSVPFLDRPANVNQLVRLKIEGGGYYDETLVIFDNNSTSNFDSDYDAKKMYASAGYVNNAGPWTKRTVISTVLNGDDYSINSLPMTSSLNISIPVIARVYTTGQYTISANELQNVPAASCVTLKDKLLNVTHDLKMGDYVCNISDTTYASRFELTVCSNATITTVKPNAVSLSNSIMINKDAQGIFVDFDFKNATKANITVTNILGQRIMDTKKVKVTNDNVYLDLNVNDQLIFVTVETENEKVTKKFLNFR